MEGQYVATKVDGRTIFVVKPAPVAQEPSKSEQEAVVNLAQPEVQPASVAAPSVQMAHPVVAPLPPPVDPIIAKLSDDLRLVVYLLIAILIVLVIGAARRWRRQVRVNVTEA